MRGAASVFPLNSLNTNEFLFVTRRRKFAKLRSTNRRKARYGFVRLKCPNKHTRNYYDFNATANRKCGNSASCLHVVTKGEAILCGDATHSHHWQLVLYCFHDLTQWHAVLSSLDAMRVASTEVSSASIVLTWMSNPTSALQLGFLLIGWKVFDLTMVSVPTVPWVLGLRME